MKCVYLWWPKLNVATTLIGLVVMGMDSLDTVMGFDPNMDQGIGEYMSRRDT